MIEVSRDTNETDGELKITTNTLTNTSTNLSSTSPPWLKRARIITALIYILLQTAYFIFIVICIALYPRCEPASETPWWVNSVFLRFSNRSLTLNNLTENFDHFKNDFNMQALWLTPVIPLSSGLNPKSWYGVDDSLGGNASLISLIQKAHDNNIQILVDYPLNDFSLQSSEFILHDQSYFLWNEQGNTSNWMTIGNNQQSAWVYDDRNNSFYLSQFRKNNDSIDLNYRNNRVFNNLIDSFRFWETNFQLDGYNLQGVSYAYEDYDYRNQTIDSNNNKSLTRHLDEDYLLLTRIRSEIAKKKIVLLDSIDSLDTTDEQLLTRYYGDTNGYLGGVQLASVNDFQLINESETNLTILFERYYNSTFYKENRPLLWSSLSSNSKMNEAFFATCLFHIGAISIDIDRQGESFTSEQLERLRQIITFARTLDVFRVGRIEQNILSDSQWLTIERARRGSKHHMIIVNLSENEQQNRIELKNGITNAVEILLTNIANPGTEYEKNALIDITKPIRLGSYEYLILRWSPSIEGLNIIF